MVQGSLSSRAFLRRWRWGVACLACLGGASGVRAAEDDGAAAGDGTTIEVRGHVDPEGLLPPQTVPKAVSAIGTAFIEKQAPTLNAFQLVNLLPGANVSSTDPYGLSSTSSLTLRGLGQDEIGVLMEGAPQNDIGYYYAYPAQFADAENISRVDLSQGSVDIDSPVVNGAGGLLSLHLDDPHQRFGVLVDGSLGSYNERRAFVRVDTGEIGSTGLRAFVSYSNNRADNWRGAGYDHRQHVDAKIEKEWGAGNHASIAFSWNEAKTSTYPAPSLADWQTYGRSYNYDATYTAGNTNYWRLYRSPFRNEYVSAPVHLVLSDRLTFDTTAYLQFGYGNSPYGTQLTTDGNTLGTEVLTQPVALPGAVDGTATVLGNFTGQQFRVGDVAKLTYRAGLHALTLGGWIDYGTDHDVESFTPIDGAGNPVDVWGHAGQAIRTADGRLLAELDERTTTVVKGFFLADRVALSSRFTLEAGFKGVSVLHNGINYLPGPQSGVHFASFAALPRLSLQYRFNERHQIFANVTTHFRAPDEYTLYNTYYGGELSQQGTTALKNEYSIAEEIGYRYAGPSLSGAVTAFHYNFRNRQLATIVDVDGALINTTLNAGHQTSYGVDAEIDWRPFEGVSFYASGEYLHARLGDDLPVGGDLLPTAGKHAVSAPDWQFGLGGTYDDKRVFGSFALKWVDRQYSSFMNDESIPGYATLDLSVGVHLAGLIDKNRTDLRLNVVNVTNPHVLSGVQQIVTNALDTVGRGGTVIAGTSPTYYIGSGRAFVVTLARQF
ncbi:TonB-dependent receptor [Novosphingobium nitrogenifigens DSM 19370]|uniref:TonB-dependent receptor n=1 Tax=Novosphingobium nitrogenifigens DSM 19370 TaxID=983920 RepID=F1Z3R2_9SPHN|nr:TonB-dependent receptor [Novosphingobium nitrogenifigens]EGD60657.1 TonB-dependent receptor [Novosphingobium nitrogenifigens DSM 19370]